MRKILRSFGQNIRRAKIIKLRKKSGRFLGETGHDVHFEPLAISSEQVDILQSVVPDFSISFIVCILIRALYFSLF